MFKPLAVCGILALAGVVLVQAREDLREEFHQTYPLPADGRVSLHNVNL